MKGIRFSSSQCVHLGSNVGNTVAGITGSAGGAFAQLYYPTAMYIDSMDTMYILDCYNYRILRWQIGDQLGYVVVNGRGSGSTLDRIGLSYAMFVDSQYNIYVSEYGNHRVTKWSAGNNTVGQLVGKEHSIKSKVFITRSIVLGCGWIRCRKHAGQVVLSVGSLCRRQQCRVCRRPKQPPNSTMGGR